MAPRRPNYGQERGERTRAKEQKKMERLRRKEEDAVRRKAEREGSAPPADEAPVPAREDR